ncbi:hypothetical protein ACFO25_09970 [Paenactinomyces guangxiensis]|uniref:Uncharacterized protein n=1 Tax=Paenactinomyces guangxiensis TaxID=1490290 RepID=A0A7W1WSA0_9BACL|nr:hypothetical protein [Paenactinomyces guangxiensis]MBA4495111.1 hypothetical protein [Paenactinomyces guangxiensis]MBH8592205.1 hypothetical protein [Paenactinomyces guangxiensis]
MDINLEHEQIDILKKLIEEEIKRNGETDELKRLKFSIYNQTTLWQLPRYDWSKAE